GSRARFEFRFVGPVMTDVTRLAAHPNVRLAGSVVHQDVIRYMVHFDIAARGLPICGEARGSHRLRIGRAGFRRRDPRRRFQGLAHPSGTETRGGAPLRLVGAHGTVERPDGSAADGAMTLEWSCQ